MGVHIGLTGRYRRKTGESADRWLARLEEWFEEDLAGDAFWGEFLTRCQRGTTAEGQPFLSVLIHPAGEPVEFVVPKPGRLQVSAKTSTVGPGYHAALCGLFHRLADERGIRWEADEDADRTGYIATGDRAALETEMLSHLQAIARITAENLASNSEFRIAWHLATSHDFFACPGAVLTPLGPRDADWVHRVADDPRAGRDVYPWWGDGLTGGFYFGRALHHLWTEMRWRASLTDDEVEDRVTLTDDLRRAFEADPSLDLPWREWAEAISSVVCEPDLAAEIRRRAATVPAGTPLVGYRRYPVRVELTGGWSVRIPGEMAEAWEDNTWSAWDGRRTVWFTTWGLTDREGVPVSAARALDAMRQENSTFRHDDGPLIGKAARRTTEEEGKTLLNLQAYSAVDGKAALCNVFFPDEADADWAVEVWHSLRAAPASR